MALSPFQIPYLNLAAEFVRAHETGLWQPLGFQINRDF